MKAFTAAPTTRLTKQEAIDKFNSILSKLLDVPVFFSSINKRSGNYWSNIKLQNIPGKWVLILNNQHTRTLRLFIIETVNLKNKLNTRHDMLNVADIRIYGNDEVHFKDSLSGVNFDPYLVKTINY
ncbi:MAG: hypothetical protein IJ309_01455 [Clostridia bacterium]|nr:hypothetical protein [Clostridia bacterium]